MATVPTRLTLDKGLTHLSDVVSPRVAQWVFVAVPGG